MEGYYELIKQLPVLVKASPVIALILALAAALAQLYKLRTLDRESQSKQKLDAQKQTNDIKTADSKFVREMYEAREAKLHLEILQARELAATKEADHKQELDSLRAAHKLEIDELREECEKQDQQHEIDKNILRNDISHIRQDASDKMHAREIELLRAQNERDRAIERVAPLDAENKRLRQMLQQREEQLMRLEKHSEEDVQRMQARMQERHDKAMQQARKSPELEAPQHRQMPQLKETENHWTDLD